jgi:transposase
VLKKKSNLGNVGVKMSQETPEQNREKLSQLSREELVEVLIAEECGHCGQKLTFVEPIKIETKQVAQLVAKPIEIVEYQRHHLKCDCGQKVTTADWSPEIVSGQDLGIRLQGLLGWLGNYGHLPYEKQQEFLRELGEINIGVGTLY